MRTMVCSYAGKPLLKLTPPLASKARLLRARARVARPSLPSPAPKLSHRLRRRNRLPRTRQPAKRLTVHQHLLAPKHPNRVLQLALPGLGSLHLRLRRRGPRSALGDRLVKGSRQRRMYLLRDRSGGDGGYVYLRGCAAY